MHPEHRLAELASQLEVRRPSEGLFGSVLRYVAMAVRGAGYKCPGLSSKAQLRKFCAHHCRMSSCDASVKVRSHSYHNYPSAGSAGLHMTSCHQHKLAFLLEARRPSLLGLAV